MINQLESGMKKKKKNSNMDIHRYIYNGNI